MKNILNQSFNRALLFCVLSLVTLATKGQSILESKNIEVTYNKTSSIVFAARITSVDRGSKDVLIQKVKGVNNILQLKAARTNFKETNLTVVTSDEKLHHFFVRYADNPSQFIIQADNEASKQTSPVLFATEITDADARKVSEEIIESSKGNVIRQDRAFDMSLALKGIFIKGNVTFYYLSIDNTSNIPYHPEVIRFYIKDKQKARRTASQEITESPIYLYGDATVIQGHTGTDLVYAIPKFTIPDAKRLNIEMLEKRGGRHLKLKIRNREIVKAKRIEI